MDYFRNPLKPHASLIEPYITTITSHLQGCAKPGHAVKEPGWQGICHFHPVVGNDDGTLPGGELLVLGRVRRIFT